MNHDEIKAALLASYEADGGINHLDGVNLPSQESITILSRDFMHLLFPGYFEERALAKKDIPGTVTRLLDAIEQRLAGDVEKSLRFAKHAEPAAWARAVTEDLLRRIPAI